ncbi:hypothetical protein JKP88DRAFT_276701 [Tribonema minus]|uniref:MYND-type domain-containing protein n=1 Tax=Tribonema minus TaxID=303371 RepID=A0A836CH36_9STRA|nr:hypothetical protein JKP88DRAFT_276701 [Tribonema minus]
MSRTELECALAEDYDSCGGGGGGGGGSGGGGGGSGGGDSVGGGSSGGGPNAVARFFQSAVTAAIAPAPLGGPRYKASKQCDHELLEYVERRGVGGIAWAPIREWAVMDEDSGGGGGARNTQCDYCDEEGAPHRCGRCRVSMYCGAQCQRGDWRRHSALCRRYVAAAAAAAGAGAAAAAPGAATAAAALADA